MEISPSRKRLLWRLLIAGIVLNVIIFIVVGLGRGHGSTGESELQVVPTFSVSTYLLHRASPQHVRVVPVSPGAPTLTATPMVIDGRDALWRDPPGWHPSHRPAYIPANSPE